MRSTFKTTIYLVIAVILVGVLSYVIIHYGRQSMIHDRGSQVMSFKLDATTHIFKQTATGGIQQVVVKNPKDNEQINLIREHLQMEVRKFSSGDFSDPSSLHGRNMPGLSDLEKGASNINITYSDLSDGGQITYRTSDINLIKSIHNWFEAQISDHGKDAMKM